MSEYKISLKAARVNANLTQEEVCNELGISKQTLINYETGRTSPPFDLVLKLCRLYKADVNAISFCKSEQV